MRYGLLSDIHGNLPALEEALAAGERLGVQSWKCLGDIIDGGAWNNECARLIQRLGIPTVRGNHDESFRDGIADDVAAFLESCPETMEDDGILFTHISPRKKRQRKIADRYEAWNVLDETGHTMIMVGHSHISAIWSERGASAGETIEWAVDLGIPCHLPDNDRYIVSVGSLGYSRDASQALRFGIWDSHSRTLTIQSVTAAPVITAGR